MVILRICTVRLRIVLSLLGLRLCATIGGGILTVVLRLHGLPVRVILIIPLVTVFLFVVIFLLFVCFRLIFFVFIFVLLVAIFDAFDAIFFEFFVVLGINTL